MNKSKHSCYVVEILQLESGPAQISNWGVGPSLDLARLALTFPLGFAGLTNENRQQQTRP